MLSRPMFDRIAFFGISWYAVLIVTAIVIGMLLASREANKKNLPQDTIVDFLIYAIPLGIICARLYYVFSVLTCIVKICSPSSIFGRGDWRSMAALSAG